MKGPTICRWSLGKARRTSKPSPKSRTRETTMSSSASHDLLSPRIGSAEGNQLIENSAFLRHRHDWPYTGTTAPRVTLFSGDARNRMVDATSSTLGHVL